MGFRGFQVRRIAKRHGLTVPSDQIVDLGAEITEQVGLTAIRVCEFYTGLAPDGRQLSDDETSATHEWLELVTVCLRKVQANYDVVLFLADLGEEAGLQRDLRPTISLLRMVQRSLTLTLSDDSSRRVAAMPLAEFRNYFLPVGRFWTDFALE